MFDPWGTAKPGSTLAELSVEVTKRLLHADLAPAAGRVRRHRADAVERMGSIVTSILANLVLLRAWHQGDLVRQHHAPRLAVPMRHDAATRYDRPGFFQLPRVVGAMSALGMVLMHPAKFKEKRTTIEPIGQLEANLSVIGLEEVSRAEGQETVWLSARMGRDGRGKKLPSRLIDYADTDETRLLRAEMEELNAFLNAQRIALDRMPQAAVTLTRRFRLRSPGDPHRFDMHGRLYGAFWINLEAGRRGSITVNGEPIADLDFAQSFPRLAYARVGAVPPAGDLYDIPGLEGHRDGVKAGFSALLSNLAEMTKLSPKVKPKLPKGWTAKRFKAAVAERHPALVPVFGQDVALDLMWTESRILVAAMLDLMRHGVPMLPMHDGGMVAGLARAAMERAAEEVAGVSIPVEVKSQDYGASHALLG